MDLNSPEGAEVDPEGWGNLQVIIPGCLLTFWLSAAVMKLNEQNMPEKREGRAIITVTEAKKQVDNKTMASSGSVNQYPLCSLSHSLTLCMLVCVLSLKGKVTFRCLMGYFNNGDLQCREKVSFVVQLCGFKQKL